MPEKDAANPPYDTDPLVFAKAVVLVFRYLDQQLLATEHGLTAKALHDWVHEDSDNKTKFLHTMVPKAQDALAKHREANTPNALVQSERKSIAELRGFLVEEIARATGGS